MSDEWDETVVSLGADQNPYERAFTVAPLVLIGTREPSGAFDLAPKHMAMPLAWEDYFGFSCTPRHSTYRNAVREGTFTVSYPRPEQLMAMSLTAAPHTETSIKPEMAAVETVPAPSLDGVFLKGAYLFLECELDQTLDELGSNSLLIGRIVGKHVRKEYLRDRDRDDNELIHDHPLFAYLHPGRLAVIDSSQAFPLPTDFQR